MNFVRAALRLRREWDIGPSTIGPSATEPLAFRRVLAIVLPALTRFFSDRYLIYEPTWNAFRPERSWLD